MRAKIQPLFGFSLTDRRLVCRKYNYDLQKRDEELYEDKKDAWGYIKLWNPCPEIPSVVTFFFYFFALASLSHHPNRELESGACFWPTRLQRQWSCSSLRNDRTAIRAELLLPSYGNKQTSQNAALSIFCAHQTSGFGVPSTVMVIMLAQTLRGRNLLRATSPFPMSAAFTAPAGTIKSLSLACGFYFLTGKFGAAYWSTPFVPFYSLLPLL